MHGVQFWVQRNVNGSEHLLRIVAIVIKRLWVVETLRFVKLEGHYHMLSHSDVVLLVSNHWATLLQHGILVKFAYCIFSTGASYFTVIFFFLQSFAVL